MPPVVPPKKIKGTVLTTAPDGPTQAKLARLERLNVLCLPALGSLDDIELHGLPFLQAAETLGLNRRKVNENIFPILPAIKP